MFWWQSGKASESKAANVMVSGLNPANLPKHQFHYFPVEDIPTWQLQPGRDQIQWRINEGKLKPLEGYKSTIMDRHRAWWALVQGCTIGVRCPENQKQHRRCCPSYKCYCFDCIQHYHMYLHYFPD